jgi:8-oxo-dGTP pyrophosphatase MutT (NUDIX family)
MAISEYVRRLRERIGTDLLLMPSAHAVIRDEAGRLLLVRHFEGRWLLPGGGIEPGETPAETVCRECWEETSVLVEPLRLLGVDSGPGICTTYGNGDRAMWVVTVFAARIVSGELRPDGDEIGEVGWFAPAELGALEMSAATRHVLDSVLAGVAFAESGWTPG